MIVNGINFYRQTNVLSIDDQKEVFKDVSQEFLNNPCSCPTVPPIQTYSDLLIKFGHKPSWKNLIRQVHLSVESYYSKHFLSIEIIKGWANHSSKNNNYSFHNHYSDCSVVYYLESKFPEYGTNILNEFIITANENSMVVFNGKILHSITNMPDFVGKDTNRISLAFDVNVENFSNTNNNSFYSNLESR